jgi:hypothetical protein
MQDFVLRIVASGFFDASTFAFGLNNVGEAEVIGVADAIGDAVVAVGDGTGPP